MPKRRGRKSASQTPAPKSDRIYGSKKNPVGSAESKQSGYRIVLSEKIINGLKEKVKEYNQKHDSKVTLGTLKSVYRRGLGAYSSSHRPTITGGVPNTRNAWAMARVNKFLQKKSGKKVKESYVQDDDLLKEEGGFIRKEESPKVIKKRWTKKKENIGALAHNIRSLRYNITRDLKSEDEKVFLTALAVALMDKTAERVGNEDSAENGHIGITGLRKKHIKIDGNTITLKYTGKSGVDHEKTFTDEELAKALQRAIDNSATRYLLCTSDKFRIKNDRVNRYLQEFDITAKDIRGYSANKWILDKLKKVDLSLIHI